MHYIKSDRILVLSFPGHFMSFDILSEIQEQVILLLRKHKNDKSASRSYLSFYGLIMLKCVLSLDRINQ